jgi:hypothetical protein
MTKLKILWKNKSTWTNCFDLWYILMFPHLQNPKYWRAEFEEENTKDNAYWFWESVNNWGGVFDED